MTLQLGVIADDFTGATDIAGFLVAEGLRTIQLNEPTLDEILENAPKADAVVIGLKTRSIPADQAVKRSREVLRALKSCEVPRFFFKYCSTFDSSNKGNIGPVTDALLQDLQESFTVIVPSLPVNGREVYRGYLFVNGELLHESGMRNHPVTPMRDSNLMRLMEEQSQGKAVNIPFDQIKSGVSATKDALTKAAAHANYAVMDALDDDDLATIGYSTLDLKLVTGGSGLGWAIARAIIDENSMPRTSPAEEWEFTTGRGLILSGSASDMTNRQVAAYKPIGPSHGLDISRVMQDSDAYHAEMMDWIRSSLRSSDEDPLVFATAPADRVREYQHQFGAEEVSSSIEEFFAGLAAGARALGVTRFIVAGGETSGAVTQALKVAGFEVGPQIDPGVPWTRSLDGALDLTLKSGNFGGEDFFFKAQAMVRGKQK